MSKEKQIDIITDLLIDFDEMGFVPTTLVPNPEAYAIEWKKKLTEALQGYCQQSEWISVDERLPERPGAYLTYTFRGYTKLSHFEEWAMGEKPYFDDYTVTHWMPLPEAPKGGAE